MYTVLLHIVLDGTLCYSGTEATVDNRSRCHIHYNLLYDLLVLTAVQSCKHYTTVKKKERTSRYYVAPFLV